MFSPYSQLIYRLLSRQRLLKTLTHPLEALPHIILILSRVCFSSSLTSTCSPSPISKVKMDDGTCGPATVSQLKVHRLVHVEGETNKHNDIIFCGDESSKPLRNIIFFGGDVQDYAENMLAHRDNKHHSQWDLESTCRLLNHQFPGSHSYVVKPSHMHLKTFSSFVNFVDSNTIGCPNHSRGQGSWSHMYKLLLNSQKLVANMGIPNEQKSESPDLICGDYILIGFSKGCVVLNQLLFDLSDELHGRHVASFIEQISGMYWLDGGHNGGSKTWITDEKILSNLINTNIHVHSHVTPYQMQDQMRKWIGREQKKFISVLQKLNIPVTNTVHFADEERSIGNHFRVLKMLK